MMFKCIIKGKTDNITYTVFVDDKKGLPKFHLFDDVNLDAYECEVMQHDIETIAPLFDLHPSNYVYNLKTNLKEQPETFKIVIQDGHVTFTRNNVKYFHTKLEKNDFGQSYEKLLDELLNQNIALRAQLNRSETSRELLTIELDTQNNFNSDLAKELEERDNKLFECFQKVINDKKKQVFELMNVKKCLQKGRKRKLETIIEPDSEAEYVEQPMDLNINSLVDNDSDNSTEISKSIQPAATEGPAENINVEASQSQIEIDLQAGNKKDAAENINETTTMIEVNYSTQDIVDTI